MKVEATLAPPHSIILVMDVASGRPPETFGGELIAATRSCVAIGTLAEQDGQTTVVLTDQPDDVRPSDDYLAFDGTLEVVGKELAVVTALNEAVLSLPVKSGNRCVRVWVNDRTEPSRIVVTVR